jgi:acyl-CoA thioesterase-1
VKGTAAQGETAGTGACRHHGRAGAARLTLASLPVCLALLLGGLPLLLSPLATAPALAQTVPPRKAPAPQAPAPALNTRSPNAGAPAETAPVIVALGDSVTAGYGLAEEESYPSLLQARLQRLGYRQRVVNAGVSGDTSAGALARLDWVLQQPVQVLIVCLGANDGLRGVDPDALRANLDAIIVRGQQAGAKVILAGMHIPTNYGPVYTRRFDAVFPALAKRHRLPFLPFLLQGVAGRPDLNQADGIHPTARGTRIVEANVWKVLKPVLDAKP